MAKIRADLVGVVYPYNSAGIPLGVALAAGDTVPKGAVVGPHLLADATDAAQAPEPPAGTPLTPEEAADEALREAIPEQTSTPAGLTEPKGNASRAAWATYASGLGVEVPEDAKRDDIKALIAAQD